ncbi:hypothetical protein J8273_0770 [Carpediemonas membranifera]|uniref:Uncharacterized protein n=1 Tax=Carpediemonas membranifera TaxID=201153 RepID=A0A8J6B250_9EUKA|nr:hypothetical protein J8273_0770 [Carpediemonas membranifera]|eukprot:KAG9397640.1 hypothetical protein J8273_0770 [Carpediemonas membranifera]
MAKDVLVGQSMAQSSRGASKRKVQYRVGPKPAVEEPKKRHTEDVKLLTMGNVSDELKKRITFDPDEVAQYADEDWSEPEDAEDPTAADDEEILRRELAKIQQRRKDSATETKIKAPAVVSGNSWLSSGVFMAGEQTEAVGRSNKPTEAACHKSFMASIFK